jgi:membrane protease YdiL (CAAX protease family)
MTPEQEHTLKFAIALPWWQIAIVLIGFPALYLCNYFTPWTKGLFKERNHSYFFPFSCSLAFLHWASVGLVVLFVTQAGGQLSNIGLKMSSSRFVMMLGAFALIGAVLVLWRQSAPANRKSRLPEIMLVMLPVTLGERVFFVFMCVTAGICEEVVYRGFGICALHGYGVPMWLAVIFVSIAFVMIHGLWSVRWLFLPYFIWGVLYSGLFLWAQSLTPGIWLHTLWDMVIVLGS